MRFSGEMRWRTEDADAADTAASHGAPSVAMDLIDSALGDMSLGGCLLTILLRPLLRWMAASIGFARHFLLQLST